MALRLVPATREGISFLESLERKSGKGDYLNSGVVPKNNHRDALTEISGFKAGYGAHELIGPIDENFVYYELTMPEGCRSTRPHVHPKGEWSRVRQGGYRDTDKNGKTLVGVDGKPLVYREGDIVIYPRGSLHRPLTEEGVEIVKIEFTAFGGFREIKSASSSALACFLIETDVPENAAEYVAEYFFPDEPAKRQRIIDGFLNPESLMADD